jgi:glutamine synthetase
MCRPRLPNMLPIGWHLHQSLLDRKSKANAFMSRNEKEPISPLGRGFLAGLLANARAAAAFATPTLNGYKRYHGVNTMAPIQAIWAQDNRGVMVRVMGEAGDPATRLENRVGEPLANPYLYMASQIYAGLDGIARKLDPGPSADAPYRRSAEPLPATLEEAVAALRTNDCFRAGFGDAFVSYYAHIKEAEIARHRKETTAKSDEVQVNEAQVDEAQVDEAQVDEAQVNKAHVSEDVTEWEHREYFDMF